MKFRIIELDGGYYIQRKNGLFKWEFGSWENNKYDKYGEAFPMKYETAEKAKEDAIAMYTPPIVKEFSLKTHFMEDVPTISNSRIINEDEFLEVIRYLQVSAQYIDYVRYMEDKVANKGDDKASTG